MRVSCFTFIRNGVRLGYPFVESIRSALPLCDEFIVVCGDCSDDTRDRIAAIGDPRIRIIDSVWSAAMQTKGYVFAQQKMIGQFNCSGDWAFYIEGDEILHEDDVETVRAAMERHHGDPRVEALYFDYHHFWGSVDWVGASHSFYRQEARIIRTSLRSFTDDSIGFLVLERGRKGRRPYAAPTGAPLYHYGNARAATFMAEKYVEIAPAYGRAAHKPEKVTAAGYYANWDRRLLRCFEGTHPAVMADWIATCAEKAFEPVVMPRLRRRQRRNLLTLAVERILPVDFSKRHFIRAKI
jgi:glycosyltransferase involved in cell wall biosynthesis